MRKVREPTRLGQFILERMAACGMERQVDLVRASDAVAASIGTDSGISDSTVSRLIYASDYVPDRATMALLAAALRIDYQQLVLFVHDGPATAAPGAVGEVIHPLALEVHRILADDSPVPDEDREALRLFLDRALEPYRRLMRRRRTA